MSRVFIGCMRLIDMPVPDSPSTEALCHRCQAPIWLSELTVRKVKADQGSLEGVEVLCMPCAQPELDGLRQGRGRVGGLSDEQVVAINKLFGRDDTKESLERLVRERGSWLARHLAKRKGPRKS